MTLHKLRTLRRFWRDDRGLAVMEFAFALPVLVMILLGCFDAARFVLINQKMSRVASQSADLVAQLDVVTEAEIDDLFVAADSTAEPFPLGTEGKVVISSIFRPYSPVSAVPTIVWQRKPPGPRGDEPSRAAGPVQPDAARGFLAAERRERDRRRGVLRLRAGVLRHDVPRARDLPHLLQPAAPGEPERDQPRAGWPPAPTGTGGAGAPGRNRTCDLPLRRQIFSRYCG